MTHAPSSGTHMSFTRISCNLLWRTFNGSISGTHNPRMNYSGRQIRKAFSRLKWRIKSRSGNNNRNKGSLHQLGMLGGCGIVYGNYTYPLRYGTSFGGHALIYSLPAQISVVERCHWTRSVEYVRNRMRQWPMHSGVVLWLEMCGRWWQANYRSVAQRRRTSAFWCEN